MKKIIYRKNLLAANAGGFLCSGDAGGYEPLSIVSRINGFYICTQSGEHIPLWLQAESHGSKERETCLLLTPSHRYYTQCALAFTQRQIAQMQLSEARLRYKIQKEYTDMKNENRAKRFQAIKACIKKIFLEAENGK